MGLPPCTAGIPYRLRRYLMQQAMARIIKTSWTTAERPLRDIRSLGSSDDRGSIPYLLGRKTGGIGVSPSIVFIIFVGRGKVNSASAGDRAGKRTQFSRRSKLLLIWTPSWMIKKALGSALSSSCCRSSIWYLFRHTQRMWVSSPV